MDKLTPGTYLAPLVQRYSASPRMLGALRGKRDSGGMPADLATVNTAREVDGGNPAGSLEDPDKIQIQ